MADKPVYEEVQEHLTRWNAPPEDYSLERLVGGHPEEGDTRATTHVPHEDLNAGAFTDDGDDDGDDSSDAGIDPRIPLESLTNEELKQRIDEINADLPEDERLSKSGNKADLVTRIEEATADDDDDEEDDEDE